jgi:uncharacterized membrane protein YgcG
MTGPAEPQRRPTPKARIAIAFMSLAVLSFALFVLVVLGQRWRQPGYAMPGTVLVVAGICVALVAAGGALATYRGQMLQPWLTVLTTLLFLAAFLTMFSIGLLLLPLALGSLFVRLRLRAPQRRRFSGPRIGAGLLLSLGLAPLGELAIEQPVVACMPDGVSNATPIWTWFGTGSGIGASGGGASSSSGHTSSGSVRVGGTTYSYTCSNGELVEFASR